MQLRLKKGEIAVIYIAVSVGVCVSYSHASTAHQRLSLIN